MKTIKSYLCTVILLAFFGVQHATAQSIDEDGYRQAMEKIVAKLDTISSVSDFEQCRNTFERVAMKYSNQWLATYYIAYTDLQMTYLETRSNKNESRLTDAKNLLEKLDKLKGVDKSETATLWGYYYMALVVSDPQVNGKKYSGDVISWFEKAKALNPKNPRAVFWSAFYNEKLPSFMRSKTVYSDELKRASRLFENEEKLWNKPHWGELVLRKEETKCQNK